jgi:hypothetical protein
MYHFFKREKTTQEGHSPPPPPKKKAHTHTQNLHKHTHTTINQEKIRHKCPFFNSRQTSIYQDVHIT